MDNAPSYDVPALRKAVTLLHLLAEADEPMGVSELAREAGVSKNMAFRLLVTLEDLGWITSRDHQPRYEITLQPFQLFAKPVSRQGLTLACQEPLRWLHRQCGETSYVGVLHGQEVLNVQVIEGSKPLRVAAGVGSTFDLHCTAHGKILLAHAPDEWTASFLESGLKRYTDQTVTDAAQLRQELKQIRTLGYALNNEEFGRGMIGLASPVFDEQGVVQAALGVFTSTINLSIEELVERVAPIVRQAAHWASGRGQPSAGIAQPE